MPRQLYDLVYPARTYLKPFVYIARAFITLDGKGVLISEKSTNLKSWSPVAGLEAQKLAPLAQASGMFAIVWGAVILLGWQLHMPSLSNPITGQVTVKANAGIAFILSGIYLLLWFKNKKQSKPWLATLLKICAGCVFVIGLLTVSEYFFKINLGVDELLFKEPELSPGTTHAGRMAPATALCVALTGLSQLLYCSLAKGKDRLADFLALFVLACCLLSLIGYAYGVSVLTEAGAFTQMSLPSTAILLALSLGLLLSHCEDGVLSVLTGDTAGGYVARRLMPAALTVPLVLGWIRLEGERAGLYKLELGLALMVAAMISVLSFLIFWTARALTGQDIERRLSENRFRGLVESAPDAIVIVDEKERIVIVNAQTDRLFGWERAELIGQPLEVLVPERFASSHRQHGAGYIASPKVRAMGLGLELYARRKDGSEFPVEVSLSPLQTAEGLLVSSVIRDISERKKAEAQLAQQSIELMRSNSELQQFAYVAAHDLQEPLRIVTSYVDMLSSRMQDKLDPKTEKYMHYIVDAARRMQSLIRDLLSFARVDKQARAISWVESQKIFNQVLSDLKQTIEETGATVTASALPRIKADGSQIAQVLQNLVSNAIKFAGVEPPSVNVSAREEGAEWVFSVKDNGIGIDPKFADRIFVIFQRLHGIGEYPGTGIGLAICKKVIERHGGRIWFESESGKGCTFFFTIPRAAEQGDQIQPVAAPAFLPHPPNE